MLPPRPPNDRLLGGDPAAGEGEGGRGDAGRALGRDHGRSSSGRDDHRTADRGGPGGPGRGHDPPDRGTGRVGQEHGVRHPRCPARRRRATTSGRRAGAMATPPAEGAAGAAAGGGTSDGTPGPHRRGRRPPRPAAAMRPANPPTAATPGDRPRNPRCRRRLGDAHPSTPTSSAQTSSSSSVCRTRGTGRWRPLPTRSHSRRRRRRSTSAARASRQATTENTPATSGSRPAVECERAGRGIRHGDSGRPSRTNPTGERPARSA